MIALPSLLLVLAAAPRPAAPAPLAGGQEERVQGAPDGAPLASGAIRELTLPRPPGTRVEHFRLDLPAPAEAGGGSAAEPIGLVRLVVGPDTEAFAAGASGLRLEAETVFFDVGTRVLHAERVRLPASAPAAAATPRSGEPSAPEATPEATLVWREIRPRSGRTLLVEYLAGGVVRSSETVDGEVVRRVHDPDAPLALPLYLVELVRSGADVQGSRSVFQPLSSELEELRVETYLDRGGRVPERVLEIHRPEGDLAGRYVFAEGELTSFRLQAGGPVASRVSPADYERLLSRHVGGDPAAAGGSESLRETGTGG